MKLFKKNYLIFVKWEGDNALFKRTNVLGMILFRLLGNTVINKNNLDQYIKK